MEYSELLIKRRSSYMLKKEKVVDDEILIDKISKVILNTPTAFNSMATHIVIGLGENHNFIWDTTKETLKKIVSPEAFKKTGPKIDVFKNAYGTILVYKDVEAIDGLKKAVPPFANRQDYWSEQNIGILVYAIWLQLVDLGYGVNMQHYDPLIDVDLAQKFSIPAAWKLEAQIVFGKEIIKPDKKEFNPLEERMKVFK